MPELMVPFDFPFGLRRGRVAQTERPAQLRERLEIVGEEDAVVNDVELQRPAMGRKGGGKKIKIGEQELAFVNFCSQ